MRILVIGITFALLACANQADAPPPSSPAPSEPGASEPGASEPSPGEPVIALTPCVRSGCSGTVCVPEGEEIMTTCEYKPEYDCYAQATCARQPGGRCGYTEADALADCIATARAQ